MSEKTFLDSQGPEQRIETCKKNSFVEWLPEMDDKGQKEETV